MIAIKYKVFKYYVMNFNQMTKKIKINSRQPCLLHLHYKTCLLNASQPRYGRPQTPNVGEFYRSEKKKKNA